jgi:5-methylcytosine-specific restriction enzyme subunit McrC
MVYIIRKAIEIERLLLLNYHPDLSQGRNHVLALMFDMNPLWEKFVYVSLRKYLGVTSIIPQQKKPYWKLMGQKPVGLKPDIVVTKDGSFFVIDTKWKVMDKPKPSEDDLMQMYAYTKYFHSYHTLLCYPGSGKYSSGSFLDEDNFKEKYNCSISTIKVWASLPINEWQKKICESIEQSIQREKESNFTYST